MSKVVIQFVHKERYKHMDTDDIIDKTLLENDAVKKLGEILVWNIVDYYEEEEEDYDFDDFDEWKLCNDIGELCEEWEMDD